MRKLKDKFWATDEELAALLKQFLIAEGSPILRLGKTERPDRPALVNDRHDQR